MADQPVIRTTAAHAQVPDGKMHRGDSSDRGELRILTEERARSLQLSGRKQQQLRLRLPRFSYDSSSFFAVQQMLCDDQHITLVVVRRPSPRVPPRPRPHGTRTIFSSLPSVT
jgi:hypothetical protein